MKTKVPATLIAIVLTCTMSASGQTPTAECPAGFDCAGFVGLIYTTDDGPMRDVMREQKQVQWALERVVKIRYNHPFSTFAKGTPKALRISCDPARNRLHMCSVSFWGMTGELATAQVVTYEFPRTGRHVGFFTSGRTYDLRPGGSNAFVLSRLKTLQK